MSATGKAREEFAIRAATEDDIAALHRLIERSVRVLEAQDYSSAQIDGALGHTLGLDTQLVRDGTYFVAMSCDNPHVIAGCGGWSFRRTTFGSDGADDRDAGVLDPKTDAAKVRAIFVDPEFARRGVGSLLLAHCEQAATAAGFRAFEMGSTLTGVALYERRGYRETGRIAVPLPNGETLQVVAMRKP